MVVVLNIIIYIYLVKAITDYKCTVCQKLELKLKKQKEKYETKIMELEEHEKNLREDIVNLTTKVQDAMSVQSSIEILEEERSKLQTQLNECEHYASK